MGIEPTRAAPLGLKNKQFGAMAGPKCDGRVNFRGMRSHVGLRRNTSVGEIRGSSLPRVATAVLVETSISAVTADRMGTPAEIEFIGPTPPPIDHWYFYFYSLWPGAFTALISALVLLAARHFFRHSIQSANLHTQKTT
jgi:hypothetical protein